MSPVDGSDIVEATWSGPFVGEFADGRVVAPGETVDVPAGQAVASGHFETDVELNAPTELPGAEVPLTEELLNGYQLGDLNEIAALRDIDVSTIDGSGAGGRVLKADIIAAILAAQAAAPTGAGGGAPTGAGRPDSGDGE